MNNAIQINQHPVCPQCGSDNVAADAAARWSPQHQTWAVSNVFDKGHGCDDCGAEDIEFVWVETSVPPTLTGAPEDGGSKGDTLSAPEEPASYRYRVTWSIDVEADSPQDAATSARSTQLKPNSIATIFTVESRDGTPLCIDTNDLTAASGQQFQEIR